MTKVKFEEIDKWLEDYFNQLDIEQLLKLKQHYESEYNLLLKTLSRKIDEKNERIS